MALFGSNRRRERSVYFPWERRGVLGALSLPRRRMTAVLFAVLFVMFLSFVNGRAKSARDVRVTRSSLEHTRDAIDSFRADHGRCPRDLVELTAPGDRPAYLASVPMDAWKRPLRYRCPARDATRAYDLVSDGPDGEPWGLDRVE